MRKIIQLLPVLVVVVAITMIAFYATKDRRAEMEKEERVKQSVAQKVTQLPEVEGRSEQEQTLAKNIFDSPEVVDESDLETRVKKPQPPVRLQERKAKTRVVKSVVPPRRLNPPEPKGDETAYYWKDFESLRTEALINPKSEYSKAMGIELMRMRQRRLGQVKTNKMGE